MKRQSWGSDSAPGPGSKARKYVSVGTKSVEKGVESDDQICGPAYTSVGGGKERRSMKAPGVTEVSGRS